MNAIPSLPWHWGKDSEVVQTESGVVDHRFITASFLYRVVCDDPTSGPGSNAGYFSHPVRCHRGSVRYGIPSTYPVDVASAWNAGDPLGGGTIPLHVMEALEAEIDEI